MNIDITTREVQLLKVALGMFLLQNEERIARGLDNDLQGEEVQTGEIIELVRVLVEAENFEEDDHGDEEAVFPNVLTNVEKFVIGSAFGSLLNSFDEKQEEAMGQTIADITEKLDLLSGTAAGAVEFMVQNVARALAGK